ncbi:MAG: NAD(P) transhydrogenase subunit alpha [Phycisphaerae bacterium]
MVMVIGVPTETYPGERRVALVPAAAGGLVKKGLEVRVEAGAGLEAGFRDEDYARAGVKVAGRSEVFAADVLVQVRFAGANPRAGRADFELLRAGQVLIGMADPLSAPEGVRDLAGRNVTAFALELLPRITRAQSMDVLSSQATIAGYRAVLLAAEALPRMFPMLMTAAGTVAAARVLVIGAGVAGLQAIATARRLGAVVSAYDVRAAVKEQIQSLGAKFVELDLAASDAEGGGGYARTMDEAFYQKQREQLARVVAAHDVVITTAAVPGARAPLLVTEEGVRGMPPGSVIVDLAAERGGNCALTQADACVTVDGVRILGPTNLPAQVPYHASQMYAKNVSNFLNHLIGKDGQIKIDEADEITRDTLVCRGGEVVSARVKERLASTAR